MAVSANVWSWCTARRFPVGALWAQVTHNPQVPALPGLCAHEGEGDCERDYEDVTP